MLSKLIVTGATREEALERSRRALAEFHVEGLATVIPFHRAVVSDPAFIGDGEKFDVHTRWIETEWNNACEPFTGGGAVDEEEPRTSFVIEVDGKRMNLTLPADILSGQAAPAKKRRPPARVSRRGAAPVTAADSAVTAPMQGTVVKVAVTQGQQVSTGDLIVVLEAMKMENPVTASHAGVVTAVHVEPGATVVAGAVLAAVETSQQ